MGKVKSIHLLCLAEHGSHRQGVQHACSFASLYHTLQIACRNPFCLIHTYLKLCLYLGKLPKRVRKVGGMNKHIKPLPQSVSIKLLICLQCLSVSDRKWTLVEFSSVYNIGTLSF